MTDMNLDELLGNPTKGTSRPSRFAPKGAKLKPKPNAESLQPSASDHVDSVSVSNIVGDVAKPVLKPEHGTKKEEVGAKPEMMPDFANSGMDMDVKEGAEDLMSTEASGIDVESEDEVVKEVDVYYTPSIDPQTRLYVFQYPLRPKWRPYECVEGSVEVRVKPDCEEVEIDLPIDTDSQNYDPDAELRLHMTKLTLSSPWNPPKRSGYAVGFFSENKFYVNPIHAVAQLRSSMDRLDSNSKDSKRNTSTHSSVDDAVKLEHQDAKPSAASKKKSKTVEQTKDVGAVWIPLKYHSMGSDMAARYLKKLMPLEESQINFFTTSHGYLKSLCPSNSSDGLSSKVPSRRSLMTLPLKERFETWLREGPPIHRFDSLKYLAPDESLEEVLAVLQEYAQLVQGLWVPKSYLVYGTDHGKRVLARDYVLLLFSKGLTIKESQIPKFLSVEMKEVLKALATERGGFKDWKLTEPPDLNFIKLNPSVLKKQEEEWQRLEKSINDVFPKSGTGMKNPLKPTTSKVFCKQSAKTTSGSTKSGISEEDREVTVEALHRLFKEKKVCSFQQISQLLKDMAVSMNTTETGRARDTVSVVSRITAFPAELQEIITQVAVNIHGICVPISSPENKKYDEFRRVVIDLFLAEGPNAKLKKATISEAAKMKLERPVEASEYQKVLQEICVSQGGAWVLKSGDVDLTAEFQPTGS